MRLPATGKLTGTLWTSSCRFFLFDIALLFLTLGRAICFSLLLFRSDFFFFFFFLFGRMTLFVDFSEMSKFVGSIMTSSWLDSEEFISSIP